jgi:SAM-dependent methyltransferase
MAGAEVRKIVKTDGQIFWEYQNKRYPDICRCGNACVHIDETAAQYCKGVGLDIGAGLYPFRDALPIRDLVNYTYSNGKQYKRSCPLPDAINAYNLSCFVNGSLDYIFSSHCLEHLDKPFEALKLWETKLKPGGILFMYLPHEDMGLWNPGAPWVRGAHKWQPKYEIISAWFYKLGINIAAGSSKCDAFYSFYIVGKKDG